MTKPFDALLINTDGTMHFCQPDNGKHFTLEELYAAIDCDIVEVVRTREPGWILIVDEEGTFPADARVNIVASSLSANGLIFGNAIYCRSRLFV